MITVTKVINRLINGSYRVRLELLSSPSDTFDSRSPAESDAVHIRPETMSVEWILFVQSDMHIYIFSLIQQLAAKHEVDYIGH